MTKGSSSAVWLLACWGNLDSQRMPMHSPEDLIILKAVAHRPKDMIDIEAVIAAQEHIDTARIAFWVRQFAELLEVPEIWTDLEKLLRKAKN